MTRAVRERLQVVFKAYIEAKLYLREDGEGVKTYGMIVREFKGLMHRNTVIKWLKKFFPEVSKEMSVSYKLNNKSLSLWERR